MEKAIGKSKLLALDSHLTLRGTIASIAHLSQNLVEYSTIKMYGISSSDSNLVGVLISSGVSPINEVSIKPYFPHASILSDKGFAKVCQHTSSVKLLLDDGSHIFFSYD